MPLTHRGRCTSCAPMAERERAGGWGYQTSPEASSLDASPAATAAARPPFSPPPSARCATSCCGARRAMSARSAEEIFGGIWGLGVVMVGWWVGSPVERLEALFSTSSKSTSSSTIQLSMLCVLLRRSFLRSNGCEKTPSRSAQPRGRCSRSRVAVGLRVGW
jgi:hypothetical protein